MTAGVEVSKDIGKMLTARRIARLPYMLSKATACMVPCHPSEKRWGGGSVASEIKGVGNTRVMNRNTGCAICCEISDGIARNQENTSKRGEDLSMRTSSVCNSDGY